LAEEEKSLVDRVASCRSEMSPCRFQEKRRGPALQWKKAYLVQTSYPRPVNTPSYSCLSSKEESRHRSGSRLL
jgi:hypothetical protein